MLPRLQWAIGLRWAIGGLALAMFACSPAVVPRSQPNIVLILSDDHNWRDYSFTGENPHVATPNIDQLAAEGLLYQRAYIPTSLCRPSIVTLLTGLHSVTTGVSGNEPAPAGSGARDDLAQAILRRTVSIEATLPRILRELGYRTLQTGKWWEGDFERGGFDQGVVRDRHKVLGGSRPRSIGRGGLASIEAFVKQAAEDDVPFFVYYAPLLPHAPHDPPRRLREPYDELAERGAITRNQAKYYATVAWFDETIGELRELFRQTSAVDGRPLEDDTLFVYAVDNGWAPVDEGRQTGRGAPDAKQAPSENGVRGPLILFWKGEVFDVRSIERKLGDTRLASTVDLLPTLLSLVGARSHRPELAQGIDLLGDRRSEVFGDTYELEVPVASDERFLYDQRETSRTSRWLIDGRYKLILPDGEYLGGKALLYELIADPGESADLAAQQPERVARMTARLDQWWQASRPTYLLAHEFRAHDESHESLDGVRPDIARDDVAWSAGGQVAADGAIGSAGIARLPFVPEPGKRYELRVGGSAVRVAFIGDGGEPLDAPLAGLLGQGWAPSTDQAPLTLVLDTADEAWRLELRVAGMLRATHRFESGNPDIRGVAVSGAAAAGRIDYLQLLETPRFESLAWPRGDTNGDGKVDLADLRTIARHFTGEQDSVPSEPKTLREGDVDGDGDVDEADAYAAVAGLLRGLL